MDTNGKTTSWVETPAGQQLQERLNDEQTLQSIDHLLERIGTLEEAVERLTGLLQQGPGLVSMATDIADETYRQNEQQGIVLEERMTNALHLAERLTAPRMVEKIDRLFEVMEMTPEAFEMLGGVSQDVMVRIREDDLQPDERIKVALQLAERLTRPVMLERLDQMLPLLEMAPEAFEMLGGVSQDVMARIRENDLKPDERIDVALQLAERLTQPVVLERLDQMLPLLEMAPEVFEMLSGIVQDLMQKAETSQIDPARRIAAVGHLLGELTEPETIEQLEQGLQLLKQLPGMAAMLTDTVDEGINDFCETGPDPQALIEIFMSACQAATNARKERYPSMGIWSMLRAPSDPDRQVAIGFLMTFLKKFGQSLRTQSHKVVR